MALNSLFCADVPLSNYSLTPDKHNGQTNKQAGVSLSICVLDGV